MKSNKKFVILIEILVITFLVISVVPVCGLSDFSSPEVRQKGFNFYAVYDRLADRDSLNIEIWHTAMSGNGKKLIFCGRDVTTYDIRLYTVNADGSDLTSIPLPAELWIITGVAIDSDGSRAFFMANTRATCIYKVEGGVATQILNISDYYEINECRKIETTADGEYVYIMEDRDDVWKIRHSGGTPVKVIEDTGVPREDSQGHKAWAVKNFAISADGSTIAFILSGYLDPTMYYGISLKKELFVLDGGGYRQLTNDKGNVLEEYLDISGDGTTIVFSAGRPQIKWYSIRSDGSAKIALEDFSFNVAGPVLNYDGTRMFYNDGGANGGRLVNTDGSGSIDLFPCGGSKFPIPLAAHWHTCISDDGNRVSFRYDALYIGHLNDPEAVPDSPIIHNIVFDPPAMPRGDSDALINLTSQISDPQGLADIERTSTVELVDGRLQRDNRNIPVYFPFAANDVGSWTDETAGDGIFSSAGKPGGKIDELDQMTVRMGVMDASKTVVIADKVLSIGGVISTPTPTLTPTPSTTPTETPTPILPTPRPTPEERPDLTISSTDYEFEDEGRVLVLFVKIANQGDTRTKQTRVYAEDPQHDWSGRESMVPAFNPEETETIEIRLDIPDEQRGTTHVFTVEVDPEDEVREIDEGNNIEWTRGIVIPPLEVTPTPTEPRPSTTRNGRRRQRRKSHRSTVSIAPTTAVRSSLSLTRLCARLHTSALAPTTLFIASKSKMSR
jgi:Tol biopolymer transport system component